jgi:ElaB/YqjD/DUF883 family membrane-anchored ribosome-binding protein
MQPQFMALQQELSDKTEEIRRQLTFSYRQVRKKARENPEESMAISIGIGVVIGWLAHAALSKK